MNEFPTKAIQNKLYGLSHLPRTFYDLRQKSTNKIAVPFFFNIKVVLQGSPMQWNQTGAYMCGLDEQNSLSRTNVSVNYLANVPPIRLTPV